MEETLDIYEHLDYRIFLKRWLETSKIKKPQLSYRYLARKTGVDAGYLAHVFHGSRHLSDDAVPIFAELLELDVRQNRYFHVLVSYGKARRKEDVRSLFECLLSLRDVEKKVLEKGQYRYWMYWYLPAVRLTLLNYDFRGDYEELAKRIVPHITVEQAKEAIALLEEMDLIVAKDDGVYKLRDLHVSTGDNWASQAILEFQLKTLELAQVGLRTQPAHLRDISTLTLAIPQEEFVTLQEMVQEFRSKVSKWAVSIGRSDAVFQLDLATFPMSLPPEAQVDKELES